MIEDPGWISGSLISMIPVRGPDAIHRRSLAILVRLAAMTLRAPDSSTSASRAPCASKWFSASRSADRPVRSRRSVMTPSVIPSGALRPVPTAVPPRGSSATRSMADSTRAAPSSIWRA